MSSVVIGSDHGGFALKSILKERVKSLGISCFDRGCHSEESVDYPSIAQEISQVIQRKQYEKAILICGTGIGMSISANRHAGIRAALCHNKYTAEMSRKHNDANILVLGARVLNEQEALAIMEIWLATPFEKGRHLSRVQAIDSVNQ